MLGDGDMQKQTRIMVGCNILTSIDGMAYPSHCKNWYTWGKRTDWKMYFYTPRRASIDRMRNETAKKALELECDYLYFYDDDCIVPDQGLAQLMSHDKDIVAGLTLIRGAPFQPMVFNYVRDDEDGNGVLDNSMEVLKAKELFPCNAVGFSCVLIKTDLFKKMEPPFFITGTQSTEDIYFCIRAQKELKAEVYCDPNVQVSHIVDRYYVNPGNRDKLLEVTKWLSGEESKDEESEETRGDDFMSRIKQGVERALKVEPGVRAN